MSDERKPNSRRWLVFLSVMLGVGLTAYFWLSCLKHVLPGMSRSEARIVLLGDREPTWTTVCVLTKPGCTPPPGLDYPTPFTKMEYPEYGFNVVYHGKDVLHQDDWKVIAVEDR